VTLGDGQHQVAMVAARLHALPTIAAHCECAHLGQGACVPAPQPLHGEGRRGLTVLKPRQPAADHAHTVVDEGATAELALGQPHGTRAERHAHAPEASAGPVTERRPDHFAGGLPAAPNLPRLTVAVTWRCKLRAALDIDHNPRPQVHQLCSTRHPCQMVMLNRSAHISPCSAHLLLTNLRAPFFILSTE
jgi:hypothetical protein